MIKWEEIRVQVAEKVATAEMAGRIYKKISSTKINSLAIIRPSYYLSSISTLVMDYITFVDRFLQIPEREWESYLKYILYIKDCCRNISVSIREIGEPLEILIENLEEIYESEEFAKESEEGDDDDEEPSAQESKEKTKDDRASADEPSQDVVREAFTADREALEEHLRVKFRDEIRISERIGNELAIKLSQVYLECIQYLRSIMRLQVSKDGEVSSVLSILIDMQYGLDDQMRRFLLEDFFIEDLPTYKPGLNTWVAHFLDELTEMINSEESALEKK
jgi:hypothetical protein